MAGDAQTRRLDHAPHGRARQRSRVPRPRPSRSGPRTPTDRSRRACRRSAASCSCARSTSARRSSSSREDGVTYAEKIGPRGPPARSRPGPRSSSSARCAPCTRTSARASRSPTARCSACTARRSRAIGERPAPGDPSDGDGSRLCARDGRLLLDCSPGHARAARRAAAGRARDGRGGLSARSRSAGAPVGGHVGGRLDARAQPRVRLGRQRARLSERDHAGPGVAARSPPRRRPAVRCGPWPRPPRSGSRAPPSPSARSRSACARRGQRPGTMCSTIASSAARFSRRILDAASPGRAASPSGSWPSGASPSGRARAPSSSDTVRHAGAPPRAPAACGWRPSRGSRRRRRGERAASGITNGCPSSSTIPRCAISASSRIASITSPVVAAALALAAQADAIGGAVRSGALTVPPICHSTDR